MIDVVMGKKKVKLSFLIKMSPGSFLSFKFAMLMSIDDKKRKISPVRIIMAPIIIINFAVVLMRSSMRFFVGQAGIEPATLGLRVPCSTC